MVEAGDDCTFNLLQSRLVSLFTSSNNNHWCNKYPKVLAALLKVEALPTVLEDNSAGNNSLEILTKQAGSSPQDPNQPQHLSLWHWSPSPALRPMWVLWIARWGLHGSDLFQHVHQWIWDWEGFGVSLVLVCSSVCVGSMCQNTSTSAIFQVTSDYSYEINELRRMYEAGNGNRPELCINKCTYLQSNSDYNDQY